MQISAATRVCGTLANPNGSTIAPVMHNAGFEELRLDFRYLAFEPEDIGEAIAATRALKLVGVSVSAPFKEAVIPYLDDVDETAQIIGAVNVVHNVAGVLKGYNSDWIGATDALKEKCDLRGCSVAVIGAGGAARAIVYGLLRNGCNVHIFNRSEGRGRRLADSLGVSFGGSIEQAGSVRCDVVVNATSIGSSGSRDDVPVPDAVFYSATAVMDINVRAEASAFLARAQRAGAMTICGTRMLVLQGAFAFNIFTGVSAPVDVMQRAAEDALGSS